jgi:hypothetical protein
MNSEDARLSLNTGDTAHQININMVLYQHGARRLIYSCNYKTLKWLDYLTSLAWSWHKPVACARLYDNARQTILECQAAAA